MARLLTAALLVLALVVVAGVVGLALYASAHTARVYQGVSIAGQRLGGLTRAEAGAAISARFTDYASTPLTLVADGQTFRLTPAEVGAQLDLEATLDAAFAYGRGGNLWTRSRAWARGLVRGVAISPHVAVDAATLDSRLRAVAPAIVRPPLDATIDMGAPFEPMLVPDVPGVSVDLGATHRALAQQISRLGEEPVAIVTHEIPASVQAESLAPRLTEAQAAVGAALVLAAGDAVWHVPAADLRTVVAVDPATAELRVDRRPLTALVAGLSSEIDRAAVDATLTVDDSGALAVVTGTDAARVDVAATVEAIAQALVNGRHEVALVVDRVPPAITDEMAAAAVDRGEALLADGVDITWSGGQAELSRGDLLRALTIRYRPGQAEPFVFGLDQAIVTELLQSIAQGFDKPARDARFKLDDGRVQVIGEAHPGRALDVDAGVRDVLAGFGKPSPSVKLAVETVEPRFTAADRTRIRLGDDVLAEASTYYGGSSEPRRNNVERAATLESGWLIPPGGTFSYVENIGAIDQSNGFVTGFGIIANGGGYTTAPVVGGGVCQVSTTIYQAAFWAGLPITERYQHPYYLRSYGEAPQGLPGLDAMVNVEEGWALDLKFTNPTDDWLAVILVADGQSVTAKIVGTDPGWEVRVAEPKIIKVVPADPKMHYTDSPELPRGQDLLVETAEDGFDVTIERTVVKDGKTIDTYTESSSFAPARNLTLRGTG